MRFSLNRLAMAVAIATVPILAFTFGWLGESATPPRMVRDQRAPAEWTLPRAPERDLGADASLLAARRPFGASIGPGGTSPATGAGAPAAGAGTANPPVQWRLGGIIIAGTTANIIVLSRPAPQSLERSELRTLSDVLPDGSVVQSIDLDSVLINREGMLVTRRMFARD